MVQLWNQHWLNHSVLEMLSNLGLDCLICFWMLSKLILRNTCMLQLFLILINHENYLDVNSAYYIFAIINLSSGKEVSNLSFGLAGLAGTRRVNPLIIIQSPISLRKQESRRAYRRNRSARLNFLQFKCGPLAVEPRYITSPFFAFKNDESASSNSENPFLLLELPDLDSDNDADSDIESFSTPAK